MGVSTTALTLAYSMYSTEKASSEAEKARKEAQTAAQKAADMPKPAKIGSFATDQQKAQALAMSAGGTIFSDQKQNRTIGSGAAAGAGKTLLGA